MPAPKCSSARISRDFRLPLFRWGFIYVRSVNGRTSAWFRGIQTRHEGHIRAGGVDKDVTFVEEPDSDINDQIDTAYSTKYRRYAASIINSINSSTARAATIKLVPR